MTIIRSTSIEIRGQADGRYTYVLGVTFKNGAKRILVGRDYSTEGVAISQAIRKRERLYEGRVQ